MAQRITDVEVSDYGIDHAQYFQGHGLCFTSYMGAALGAGANPREAWENAWEDVAQQGYDVTPELELRVLKEWLGDRKRTVPTRPSTLQDEMYYYIGLRFNVEEEHVTNTPPILLPWEKGKAESNPGPYDVFVGNIGNVYSGPDEEVARRTYADYVNLSQRGIGRVAGEDVDLFFNRELLECHQVAKGMPTEDEVMDDVNRCETDA